MPADPDDFWFEEDPSSLMDDDLNARGIHVDLDDEADTEALAEAISALARPGDLIALAGPLGAGKTVLARAFLRHQGVPPDEEVPSPTYTLSQEYVSSGGRRLRHLDLYRLEKPEDALELDLEEGLYESITLIEWPDRLGPYLPWDRLDVILSLDGEDDAADPAGDAPRHAEIIAHGSWLERLDALADAL